MTPKEAFKIGFLQKCAADRLTQEETLQRIVHAKFMLKTGGLGDVGLGALKALWGAAWPLALLAPPLAGMGAGAVLARAQDDTYDKDEARKREEISEYSRAVERLQRLQARQAAMGAV